MRGELAGSRIACRAMLCRDEPLLRLRLRIVWSAVRKRLRLRLASPEPLAARTDLVSGGPLDRPVDGLEYPLGGGLLVGDGAARLAVVAPEVFSASVDSQGVSLTLLRSPYVAHHDPFPADGRPDQPVTDQGSHELDLLVWPACDADAGAIQRLAADMQSPPIVWDLTG